MITPTLTFLAALAIWSLIVVVLTRGLMARGQTGRVHWATATVTTIFWLVDPLTAILCVLAAGLIAGDFRR